MTAFLSRQGPPSGMASSIFLAYKHGFMATGLEPAEWISKVMYYCANGAVVM